MIWHDPQQNTWGALQSINKGTCFLAAVAVLLVSLFLLGSTRVRESIDLRGIARSDDLLTAPSNCSFDFQRIVKRGKVFLANTCCDASPVPLKQSHRRSDRKHKGSKALVTLAAGGKHFDSVKQVILRFGHQHFDFWLFLWDTPDQKWRSDPVIGVPNIKHIWKRRMHKYQFAETFLTPTAVAGYTHIFLWDGDVDLTKEFDPIRYLALVKRARLAVSQPALSSISKSNYAFNKHSDLFPALCPRDDIVVLEDFIEVGFFVFNVNVWVIIWKEVLSVYAFKYWCFDLLPFDCLVDLYLQGVADGTKSLKINDHFTLSKNIPRRRGVVWSEQVNHFGEHTNTEDWETISQENAWFNELMQEMTPVCPETERRRNYCMGMGHHVLYAFHHVLKKFELLMQT